MNITLSDKIIAWMALLSGLSISAVAIYYSVAGLVSIFAAAAIPIIVMGVVLEVGKLVATVWLKQNWIVAPRFLKSYLLIAITVLMLITSMGIFGYLSKAHLDQAVPTGDIADKVALIDQKIKNERENIETSRRALEQLNAQVDQRLSRSNDEKGAERAVEIRRAQARERQQLQNDIAKAQANISKLNDEKAPVAKELRKVEAEVGPIKYIAALIYGDNPDSDLLEKAVRWVIIVIVLVFDPLAVILLLASQYSFNYFRLKKLQNSQHITVNQTQPVAVVEEKKTTITESDLKTQSYLNKPWKSKVPGSTLTSPQVVQPEESVTADSDKKIHKEAVENSSTEEISIESKIEEIPTENSSANEDDHILNTVHESEKTAMAKWKADNPTGSLKLQRQLLEKGIIKELPWMQYLKAQPDYEQEDVKKNSVSWMERQGSTLIKKTLEK